MKRKRIQYNELNEEIYGPKNWSKARLIFVGIILLCFGFLFNFSLEDKINKLLIANLSNNDACPIVFEKIELSYFLPKISIKNPVIMGSCFGQINNKLSLQNITIALASPSIYPPGIKLHLSISEGKTKLNIYPIISLFSSYIDFKDSRIDSTLFAAMTNTNKSPVAGILSLEGFLKFSSGSIVDGQIDIQSNDFHFPAQTINSFEIKLIDLKRFNFSAHFANSQNLQIDRFDIGTPNSPLELKLKGNLIVRSSNFMNSQLLVSGPLHLSTYLLTNFEFIKLFLPTGNANGTYQMKLEGPLNNLGKPEFK